MNFNGETRNATPHSEPDERGPLVAVSALIIIMIVGGAAVAVHLRSSEETHSPRTVDESTADFVGATSPYSTLPAFVARSTAAPVGTDGSTVPDTTAFDRARALALDGRDAEARRFIERRVRIGKGTPDEARFLKQLCKKVHDAACVEDIKAHYPSR